MDFFKIIPKIAHCLRSHPINFEDNRINSDEYIVLLRFFGGHLGNNTILGIFTKIVYNNYLPDYIPQKTNYSEHLLQSGSMPQQYNCIFFNDNCGSCCFQWIFIKILPDIAHGLRSHQINFQDNRIHVDENLVLFRFIGGHLGKSTLLGIITKILYRNYLL